MDKRTMNSTIQGVEGGGDLRMHTAATNYASGKITFNA